jgi:methyl-accepting chemotaxis protein
MSVVDSPDETRALPARPSSADDGPRPQRMRMIDPPPRGDGPARACLWLGIAFYAGFAFLFIWSLLSGRPDKGRALLELFGIGEEVNLIILLLIVAGIGLTLWAGVTVVRDIRLLKREEEDVEWVLKREREGLMLVFAPVEERDARFARGERSTRPGEPMHVETLVDDRVRRVHESALGAGTHMPVEELRGIAETRTARFGHVARFASSLLLLLAVLGTFAGVKTALPSLIDAIGAAEGAAGTSIVGPLRAVADAFGGNALALVGAIAVGLMAQGLAVGRRNLLERLELASAEYIYENRRTHSADPLIAAVETLSATAGEVHEASMAFLGIEGSLEALGDSFRAAFASLNDQLADVMRQQDEMLHQRTSQALEELQSRVVALAGAVEANTRSYQGLVDRVGERAAESREAVRQMQAASELLAQGLQGILQLSNASGSASMRLEEGIRVLVQGTERVDQRMAAVAEAVERARPALQEVEAAVAGAADRVSGIDARAAASWKAVAEDVRREFAELARAQAAVPAPLAQSGGVSPLPADAVGLLRRIAAAAETPRGPSPRLLALSAGAGVLGAAGVVYVIASLGGWIAALVRVLGV